jgi:hypothetical protein
MPQYTVSVQRTIDVSVRVEAKSPEEARAKVQRRDFELPPRDEWTGQKNWEFAVYDADGNTLIDYED